MSPTAAADGALAAASFVTSLETGVLRWDRLLPFPEQEPSDRARTEAAAQRIEALFAQVDPEHLDQTRELPDGLLDGLRAGGFLNLANGADSGGLGLSPYGTFSVIARACARSVAAGQVVAIQNGVGAAALLPALPAGPARDFVVKHLAAGHISGFGDTDQSGQNNALRTLTATPVAGGYLLNGDKLFTGNGPIAELLAVSATVPGDRPMVVVCFVDGTAPGFSVSHRLQFMGSHGLPNGSLAFSDVFVPRELVLLDPETGRLPRLVGVVALLGRIIFTGAPAMAIARNCVEWSRAFVRRRQVDGRPLAEYDAVAGVLAANLADLHAMETTARWSLLDCGLEDRWFERFATKNLLARGAWRIVDRTMSLFGGEGFETETSKRGRGAVPVPLERAFRDARGLRIAGNVDFQLDNQLGRMLASNLAAAGPGPTAAATRELTADLAGLSHANDAHARVLAGQLIRFRALTTRFPGAGQDLKDDERRTILLGRGAAELFAAAAVLARAAGDRPSHDDAGGGAETESARGQLLADAYCSEAGHRLGGILARLETPEPGVHRRLTEAWLADDAAPRP